MFPPLLFNTNSIYFIIDTLTVDRLFAHKGGGVAEYKPTLPGASENYGKIGKISATCETTSFGF